ncbi:unnamed protein product [Adineta ricciae]|uniref:Uncharacterized protein n=1 Tax=Adineta ricciae TaxID=249248 RepID=A0A814S4Z1_ADIRI|nr:unnamed protein product [Adineta ricciae]CAF1446158.1 unnamed protein product [Adineta ricciae]
METRNNGCLGSIQYLKSFLVELNIFRSNSTDENVVRIEKWSTRFYVLILSVSIVILSWYNALHTERRQVEIKSPSMNTYIELQNKTGVSDIMCPCAQISSLYGSFVELIPTYHEICSSIFISQQWIEVLFDNITSMHYILDFRATASLQFQVLRELCSLSQLTINNMISNFFDEEFICNYLLSEDIFNEQIQAVVDNLQAEIKTDFLFSFSFVRSLIYGNQMWSAIQTNFILLTYTFDGVNWRVGVGTIIYPPQSSYPNGCICDSTSLCPAPTGYYDDALLDTDFGFVEQLNSSFLFQNWFVNCWPLESLLSSSLEQNFLTNQSVLNIIAMHLDKTSSFLNLTLLASLNESMNINQNNTLRDISQSTMFLKKLSTNITYSQYFTQCQPKSCLYTLDRRVTFLYMFTTLCGLFGGLSVVLRLIIPYVVAFFFQRSDQRSLHDTLATSSKLNKNIIALI